MGPTRAMGEPEQLLPDGLDLLASSPMTTEAGHDAKVRE